MRLRYLHIRNYPPLEDVELCFNKPFFDKWKCAIRFVVGVNGSGKTHLLQAVTETFIALARQDLPNFPVTLAWELGDGDNLRTLLFDSPSHGAKPAWWQWQGNIPYEYGTDKWNTLIRELYDDPENWEVLSRDGQWPGKGVGLPKSVLVYTTGCIDPWQWLFRREPSADNIDQVSQAEEYDSAIERPAGWTREQEIDYLVTQGERENNQLRRLQQLSDDGQGKEYDQDVCLLIDSVLLKFALLAVYLSQTMQEYRQYETEEEIQDFIKEIRNNPDTKPAEGKVLRYVLSQVGWVWAVSIGFKIDFHPETLGESERRQKGSLLKALFILASEVVREPEPSTQRWLYFDLKAKPNLDLIPKENRRVIEEYFNGIDTFEYIGDALLQFLGGANNSPFDYFKQLLDLRRKGLLIDIQIAVRKADLDDILLFDELSDGEQVYLGRMALFHLLEGEDDALLLLDEPEVHFNDKWKREIVDIIDRVLKERNNDVLISTHSSIALTDVFNDEIILFEKREGNSVPIEIRSTTFGADPSEVMIRLFDVPDSIGERALRWLDKQLDREWGNHEIEELERLLKLIGPGFHRSELRGILRRLKENVISD